MLRPRTADWAAVSGARRRVLLVGGSSEIGLAILARLASDGAARAYLLGRDRSRLDQAAVALRQAGCEEVTIALFEASESEWHGEVIARVFAQAGGFDLVVLALGVLGAQAGFDADPSEAFEVMQVNFLGSGRSSCIACGSYETGAAARSSCSRP